jgi:hypothetical protein
MLGTASCGGNNSGGGRTYEALSDIASAPLSPGVAVAIRLAGEGDLPVLALTYGRLPEGLSLGDDGFIRGTPRLQGEVRRFSIQSSTVYGEPLEQRDYTLAVGVAQTTLAMPAQPTRQDDALTFDGLTWNRPLRSAFVWDPTLSLLWPLSGTSVLAGRSMASPGEQLDLVVAGSDAQGRFELKQNSIDPRLQTLTQLTWDGDSDIDLVMIPEPSLSTAALTKDNPNFERSGAWMARHNLASTTAPGPEVVSFAEDVPVGRYALVAMKRSGGDIRTQLWLTIKARSGQTLVERRFDSLFSDVAVGTFADEVAAGRQSYKLLGSVAVTASGAAYVLPPTGVDPFASEGTAE